MTGDARTFIGNTGFANTGSGHVTYIQGVMAETLERLGRPGRDPRTMAGRNLRWLRARFVPPSGSARARRRLGEWHTVALAGPPGSGRRTTAWMLLHELAPDGDDIHEIDLGEEDEGSALDARTIGRGDRLLLDLSGSDIPQFLRAQRELTGFRAVVERQDAHLVVVLPQHAEGHVDPELRPVEVTIQRPPPHHVLARYLRRAGITPKPDELDLPELASSSLAEVADLARLVDEARGADPEATFQDWLRAARNRLSEDGSLAATFVAGLPDGRRRALALTVALFHGAPPEIIHRACTELLNLVDHTRDDRPRFDRTDLGAELGKIGALPGRDGRTRFAKTVRETAVLHHFWTYFPDLRGAVQWWVEQCLRHLPLDGAERAPVVARFAEQVLRSDEPVRLVDVAGGWTGRGSDRRLVPDATQALAIGVRHPRHGRAVRRKILERAREPGLSEPFRLALALVCSEVMAVHHPDQALVRLHHLARAEADLPRRPAWDALLGLAAEGPRRCAQLLQRLLRHIGDGAAHLTADRRILLALTGTIAARPALCADDTVQEPLVLGWAEALGHLPHQEWEPPVRRWLAAVLEAEGQLGDCLVTTLATAGAASPRAVGRMYVISRTWANEVPEERTARRPVADHLRRALDTAQGLDAWTRPAPTPNHHTTENVR
ncbi:ATP-binding protein [Streptomyces sp. NBRC 109706]|uniref:ATP-binding protein n=1 Tax=Streptomyces sp. NBRC 109706 TaxID=1550035 RepID=UPI0007846D7F|nr:ATP-binding protein [Streptomyces sp. NBRC 109706]